MAVQEILVGSTPDQIFVAMEFVEHDMKSLLETMTQKVRLKLTDHWFCIEMD